MMKYLASYGLRIHGHRRHFLTILRMPVHFLSGSDDPCMGNPKDFQHTVNLMKSAGYKRASSHIFPKMRHEILNETDKLTVWNHILQLLSAGK